MRQFPESIRFTPVSPRLTAYRQVFNALSLVTTVGVFVVAGAMFNARVDPDFWHGFAYLPAVALTAYDIGLLIVTPFQVRIHGYSEQSDDLLIRAGAVFRKYEAIPYGRLQYVEVRQGPLQRRFDLADVTMTTAGSKATIHGVPTADAARLRDDLSARGYARLAGL